MPRNFRSNYSYKSSSTRFGGRTPRKPQGRRGQYIDPSRFIRVAKPVEAEDYVPLHQFSDFNVNDVLKANLTGRGIMIPTPIQDQTIPAALAGQDVIGVANTGTGKTLAFALPLLHKLMADRSSRALIVAPTRELAQQIEAECKAIARGSGLSGALLIGGAPMGPQLRDLRHNPSVVIGTPGRITDHLERGTLDISSFNFVVLDEVDRMLDMGFVNDVRAILNRVPQSRQSFFFSATLDSRISGLIEGFANEPVLISIKTSETSENVHQDIIRFSANMEKLDKLHDILAKQEVEKVIVFDDTQRSVERLSQTLNERGFTVDAIHGGKSQGQRQRALSRFKKNEIKILVATDVAARGIDIADITHVINYSTPQSYEDYVHRIGRAGRAGKIGYALTFVNG